MTQQQPGGWYARVVNGRQVDIESAYQAQAWAAASISTVNTAGVISWTDTEPGTRGLKRHWELRPITDQQAAEWAARAALNCDGA